MKTFVTSIAIGAGLLASGAASADQYIGNACVARNGDVRFVDGLKANNQKCKKSETEANYQKTGKIYDSAGQLLGYGTLSGNPYSASVFVPSLGKSISVTVATDPATGRITDLNPCC